MADKETPKKDKKADTKRKTIPPLAIDGFAAIQPSTPKAKTSRGESGRKEPERISKHKSVTSTPSSNKLSGSNSSRPNSSRGHRESRESREKDRSADEKELGSPSLPSSPPNSPKRTLSPRDSPAKTERNDEARKHFQRARSSSNEHMSPKKTSRRERDSDGTSEEPRRLRDSGRNAEKEGRRTKRTQSLETERLGASLSVTDDQAASGSTSSSKRSPKKSTDSATQGRNSKIKKFTDTAPPLQSKPSQSTMTLQIALASLDSFNFHEDNNSATLDITNMVSMLSDDYDHHDINHEEMLLSDNSIENALSSLANFSDKSPSTAGLPSAFLQKTNSLALIQKRIETKTPQKFHRNSLPLQSDSSPDCHNAKPSVPQAALPPSLLNAYNALCESVKRDLEEIGPSKAETFQLLSTEHDALQKQLAQLEKQLQEKRESAKALEAKNLLLKEQLNDLTLLC